MGVLGYAFPLFLFIPYLALVIEKIIKKTDISFIDMD